MQTIKAHGGDARVHIYTATALERGRVSSSSAAVITLWEHPWHSCYRRLGEFQDQSGHEEVKKNLHTTEPGDRTLAVQPEKSCPRVRCELLSQRLKIHVLICAAIRRTTRNLLISAKCRLNYVFPYPMQYTVFYNIHCYS